MKVRIAGYNIDKSLMSGLDKHQATPEVISAAYARISRSSKDVTSLRKQALNEVEKARTSNESIIFGMGHGSIAEHAVFNIDLLGVTRFITEFIQKSRLASFTEKSQRYVTLKSDYLIPSDLPKILKQEYIELMTYLFNTYHEFYEVAKQALIDSDFKGPKRDLEGKAKEDARYILPLSTLSQMGMTINARSLERLLKRLDKTHLEEAKTLKEELYKLVSEISPSVVKYVDAEAYDFNVITKPIFSEFDNDFVWKLISHSTSPDINILAYLIFEQTGESVDSIKQYLETLNSDELKQMFNNIFDNMKAYHLPIKAFEASEFEFQLDMSSSCFAQLKRHRMATIIKSDYNPEHGYVIPPQITELGLEGKFNEACSRVSSFFKKLDANIAPYVLTNSHKVRVLFKANLRELYHFSRLRSDKHAQWEIQNISDFIISEIKKVAPLSASLMMGKHQFNK